MIDNVKNMASRIWEGKKRPFSYDEHVLPSVANIKGTTILIFLDSDWNFVEPCGVSVVSFGCGYQIGCFFFFLNFLKMKGNRKG